MKNTFVGILLFCAVLSGMGCHRAKPADYVVLYTSQDQFYAEPILKEFSARTGIEVRPVFDSESAKTAGLAHRLRAERSNPQCDVFWSNEEMHTRLLVRDRVIDSNNWHAAGFRTRRLVLNTNHLSIAHPPKSLLELTNSIWNGRVALAYPLFGTTKSHFLALRQLWGEGLWKNWCYGLVRNGAKFVDGNSVVVKLVAKGECQIGLTDWDDIAAGIREGMPLVALPLTEESFAIPSTVGLVLGAPHPAFAQVLIDYLQKPATVQRLVSLGALETTGPQPEDNSLLKVDWRKLIEDEQAASNFLELIFVRS